MSTIKIIDFFETPEKLDEFLIDFRGIPRFRVEVNRQGNLSVFAYGRLQRVIKKEDKKDK
jgi:hypothetical protein